MTSDINTIEVDIELAKKSEVIKNKIEDCGNTEYIHLAIVSKKCLEKVI